MHSSKQSVFKLFRPAARSLDFLPHDLLRIGGSGDLRFEETPPAWVYASLKRAGWAVTRRSSPLRAMIPVGVRGNSRGQRFAAYLAVEAIIERVIPEQLSRRESWRRSSRRKEIPALEQLDSVFRIMSDFGLQWGPTGSVGYELATGLPAATKDSDLDLLIRAPDELELDLCRRVRTRLSAQVSVRTDVLIETGTGAIALDEYVRGDLPILLRSSNGPKLVYHPWRSFDECRLHISGAGITGAGDVAFPSEASSRSAHSGRSRFDS